MVFTVVGQRGGSLGIKATTTLENLGADAVGHLATHHDDDAVTLGVGKRHGGAHGVAVAAEHAAVVVHRNRVHLFTFELHLGRLDGRGGAGGDGQGNLAHFVQVFVVQHGRFAVVAQIWRYRSSARHRTCSGSRPKKFCTWAGMRCAWKSAKQSSMTALTGPEASVAGVWQ
jgi:hypothetical protein